MPKTVDTRKQCKGMTPQGRRCKFKCTPGHLYCGVHVRQLEAINARAKHECVFITDNVNTVPGLWLPMEMVFEDHNGWGFKAMNVAIEARPINFFSLVRYRMAPAPPVNRDVINTRDPDAG